MSAAPLAAGAAAALIGDDGEAVYVDVRTVAEFVQGHPRGRVINLPLVFHHPRSGEEHPNEAFALVARHALPPTTPLVVGAADDDRATRAAAALAAAGFADVRVLAGGHAAWRAAGLPVTGDNRDGVSYVSLLTPARRAAGKRGAKA